MSEPTRAAMEAARRRLRRLRTAARRSAPACASTPRILPELAPSRDLWSGIAARIETPVLSLRARCERSQSTRWTDPLVLGLAAAGTRRDAARCRHRLDGATGGQVDDGRRQTAPIDVPGHADRVVAGGCRRARLGRPAPIHGRTDPVQPCHRSTGPPFNRSLASNKPTAEQTYDREIARLRAILNAAAAAARLDDGCRREEESQESSTTRSRSAERRCGAIRRAGT